MDTMPRCLKYYKKRQRHREKKSKLNIVNNTFQKPLHILITKLIIYIYAMEYLKARERTPGYRF